MPRGRAPHLPSTPRATAVAGALLIALAVTGGCASNRNIRPLGAGNAAGHLSLGGPLVAIGDGPAVILPTPILMLGGSLGVRPDTEVTANLNATAALFGVAHLQAAAAYHPIIREGGRMPTLTLAGGAHLLTNISDTRFAPHASAAAAWRVRRVHLIYTGAELAMVFGTPTRPVWGPFAGGEARLGRRAGFSLEVKWLSPSYDVAPLAPAWISPASRGYLSVLLGLNVYFGDVP